MKKIRMAYCPTMEPFAERIADEIDLIEAVPAGSAAMVLKMLQGGMVESVLIGRTAKSYELDGDVKHKRLREGVTLVYKDKTSIYQDQLKEIPVKTYLDKNSLGEVAGFFTKIAYLDSKDDCLNGNLTIPALINWRDFRDSFELLIPVDENGKVKEFRAPVIYYNKNVEKGLIENIYKIVGKD
ncbi:MAG: hypothetical protein J7K04_06610 [Spirochaetales bacterium]|nr:hypothetical protein [Spirochaetales bacterium]